MRRLGPAGILGLGLALALAALLGPVAWQLLTSLKPVDELERLPPLLPSAPTLRHYRAVFDESPFVRYLWNGTVVALATTALSLALGAPAAYGLARGGIRAPRRYLYGMLAVSMIPPVSIVGPLYLGVRALGLRDTWWGLVLADTAFALPLTVWMLAAFFRDVPRDLLRAARVDGATPWQAFVLVALPAVGPGLAAAAILAFVFAWNELLFALSFTSTPAAQTVPVGIALFAGVHEVPWGEIAAASLVGAAPAVLLVLALERRIVQGLTAGAVKE